LSPDLQPPPGKFGRRDRLAVVLHHDATRQKILRDQNSLQRTRQFRFDGFPVATIWFMAAASSSPFFRSSVRATRLISTTTVASWISRQRISTVFVPQLDLLLVAHRKSCSVDDRLAILAEGDQPLELQTLCGSTGGA